MRGNETDGAFLSSVTFQLEKIFEDKDDGKGDMYISMTLLLDFNRGHLITRNCNNIIAANISINLLDVFIQQPIYLLPSLQVPVNESPSIVLLLMLHAECDFSELGLDLTLSVIV